MKPNPFQQLLAKNKIDLALFITSEHNDPNIAYFTQLDSLFSVILAFTPNTARLYTTTLDYGRCIAESRIQDVVLAQKGAFQTIKKDFKPVKTIGTSFALPHTSFQALQKHFPRAKIVDVAPLVRQLRIEKTEEEIEHLKKACTITSDAFEQLVSSFNFHDKSEKDVANFLDAFFREQGAENAFKTIVASGSNAARPHHMPTTEKLQRGFCVIDFGARWKNYCADMTRTIFIGNPTAEEKKLYALVLQAQEDAIAAAKEGVKAKQLDTISRKTLGSYAKFFTHSLGHGIGIEVHEEPWLRAKSEHILRKNMAFTIEPGIYFPNKLGIRIEDTFIMDGKAIVMTHATKELLRQ